jgi:tRNA (cmo5U34)-methyltransferase
MSSWTFDTPEIADLFDDHVREQLPWYDMVTDAVVYIARNYLTQGSALVDIGSSTGNLIDRIMPLLLERKASAYAIEKSPSMAPVLAKRFQNEKSITVIHEDVLTLELPKSQVCILFLTMMFVPVHERQGLLKRIKSSLVNGGALIVVDKVCDHGGYFATVLKRLGMHFKLQQGAKQSEVLAKEMSLAGVQFPLDPKLLGDEAKMFFRMGEFAGWVVEV